MLPFQAACNLTNHLELYNNLSKYLYDISIGLGKLIYFLILWIKSHILGRHSFTC